MKCAACGEDLPVRATFCPACGVAVDEDSSPTVTSMEPRGTAGQGAAPGPGQSPGAGAGAGAGAGSPATPPASGPGRQGPRSSPAAANFDAQRTSGAERSRKAFTSSSASSRGSARGSSSPGQYVAGTTLADRYRIVSLLGKGGMGEVYRAEDLKLNQAVALKFLPVAMHDDEVARERFYQEVRLAREISHANVCRVFDIGELDGRLFLTMEYVDGEDLASLLRRIGQFPQAKGLDIARQMCAGLAAAHDHGVLHRDLKPGNIMLDGRGRVRITDFGLAALSENMGGEEVSAGTPAYMAPEQLAGVEVTQRSDIYSLGLVMYEIFTGKKAYEAASIGELLRLRESSSPSAVSALVKDIDPLTERVIQRCLERDPAKRPASAIQVAAALPGGDPLAAALAAGETPSPAMVAASGEKEGLRPAIAWGCLLLTILGLAAVALLSNKSSIINVVPMPMSGEVLAAKAHELTRSLGYAAPPVDTSYGFGRYSGFVDYIQKHDQSKNRWEQLKAGNPPAVAFWYRESPQYMVNLSFTAVAGAFPDAPTVRLSGMVQEFFTPEGQLVGFEVVPPQLDTSPAAAPAPDWSALFAAAGLDQKLFQPATPQWTELVASDERAAWTGTYPGRPDLPLRIEAAAYKGKPVYFDMISTWDKPDRMREEARSTGDKIQNGIAIAFLLLIVVVGIVLARQNVRAGRSDWKGAARLALFSFLMTAAAEILFAHHVPTLGEIGLLLMTCGVALIAAALLWLMYVALEPHVRKRWPSSLISWSRVLGGQILDPVVGRDVLVGVLTEIVWSVALLCKNLLPGWLGKTPNPPDSRIDFITLSGIHITVADILINVTIFVTWSLALFFLFFLVRLLLRKQWLAVTVTLALLVIPAVFGEHPVQGAAENLLVFGIALLLLVRFGLLALVVAFCLNNVLVAYPLTGHLTEWYAQPTILVFTMIVALAIFGFYTSTAGKPRLGSISLDG
jgi:serine/threonine-protein kinase